MGRIARGNGCGEAAHATFAVPISSRTLEKAHRLNGASRQLASVTSRRSKADATPPSAVMGRD